MQIIHENEYEETMKNIVTPYLLSHRRELYVPGADYPFRNESKRITGKIHMLQYLSDIDMPKGVVVISHGFTESAVKYDEVAYYFLKEGYHVYIPEHCGHGRSYRLTADPSLVHIDTWRRYIRDFLKACRYIKKAHPDLSLNLYAHSMGGAIGGIAAAHQAAGIAVGDVVLGNLKCAVGHDLIFDQILNFLDGQRAVHGQAAVFHALGDAADLHRGHARVLGDDVIGLGHGRDDLDDIKFYFCAVALDNSHVFPSPLLLVCSLHNTISCGDLHNSKLIIAHETQHCKS